MKRVILQLLSLAGLLLTVVPSAMVLAGSIQWQTHAILMLIGTALWFATAPLWMRGQTASDA